MALNFPGSPVDKQIYIYAATGAQYVYDAANTRWTTNTFISNVVSGYYSSVYDTANAAFGVANNALPNVSNAVFNGNLRVTGNLLIGTNTVTIRDNHIISAEYYRMNTDSHMVAIPDGNRVNTLYTLANTAYDAANTVAADVAAGSITVNNISLSGNINPGTVNVVSQTLTDSANISWNLAQGAVASVTLGGNRYVDTPSNLKIGTLVLHVYQDGTGSRTLTWSPTFKWPAGVPPVLTTTASHHDLFSFVCDGTYLYGSYLPDVR